jgi:hypothetical protein
MKRFVLFFGFLCITSLLMAVDVESFHFVDHLLSITKPEKPEIFEDSIIFTAPSTYHRVGIAFAHEDLSKIYWFKKLLKVADTPPSNEKDANKSDMLPQYKDSGILFFVYEFPHDLHSLKYRLIIDGQWCVDPFNPDRWMDPISGIVYSILSLPEYKGPFSVNDAPGGCLRFNYETIPGETITVAGTFNNWDPFMYKLIEESPGHYVLTLQLPPGTYRYVYYHRGERILDPNNSHKVYTTDGQIASEAIVK